MDISEYTRPTGKFLKAEDVKAHPTSLFEISGEGNLVKSEKFGVERLHLPVKVGEQEYIFDCLKTNARTIEKAVGSSDTSKWIGKLLVLELYKTKTSDGQLVEAINVKEVR